MESRAKGKGRDNFENGIQPEIRLRADGNPPVLELEDLTSTLAQSVISEILQLGNGRKRLSEDDGDYAHRKLTELAADPEAAAQAVQWTRRWAQSSKDENLQSGAWEAFACGDPNWAANDLKKMLESDRESALDCIISITKYLGPANRILFGTMAPALNSIHWGDRYVAFEVFRNSFVGGGSCELWDGIAQLTNEVAHSARAAGIASQRLERGFDSLRGSFFTNDSEIGRRIVESVGSGWRPELGRASEAVEQYSLIIPHNPTTIALVSEIDALIRKSNQPGRGGKISRYLEEIMDRGATVEDAAGRLVQWTKKKLNRDDNWFADKALMALISVDRVAACAVLMERLELSAKKKERFHFDESLMKALGSDAVPLLWRDLGAPKKDQRYPFGSFHSALGASLTDVLPKFCELVAGELEKMELAPDNGPEVETTLEHAWKAGWGLLEALRENLNRPEPATYQATSAGLSRIIQRVVI